MNEATKTKVKVVFSCKKWYHRLKDGDHHEYRRKSKRFISATVEQAPDVISGIVLEGVVGTVVPGVSGAMLAYRQKRQERIYGAFLEKIKNQKIKNKK